MEKLTSELKLDVQQQEQIKLILAEQSAKNQEMKAELMKNGGKLKDLSPEEREAFKQKRKEDKTAIETKLKAILTPEQFKKMKEIEAENREANREKMREFREARQDAQMEE